MPRLQCLDGLRGLLALYVLLGHMAPFAAVPGSLHAVPGLFAHGMAAVDVFFILSGLVITGSLARFEGRAGAFLIARAFRIMPVFLLVFAAAIGVQTLGAPFAAMPWIGPDSLARGIWAPDWPQDWVLHVLAHLTMTHGLLPDGSLPFAWVTFLGAAWSLSTEWQFYLLVIPVAAWLGHGERGAFRMAALFLAAAACAIVWQRIGPPGLQFSRAFLPNKAQYFALGIASVGVLRGNAWRRYGLVLVATCLLSAAEGGAEKLAAPLLWTICLAVQRHGTASWAGRILASPALLWLGALSYCIYLVNEPVQRLLGVVLASLAPGSAQVFTIAWVPGAVLLPIGIAWLLHHRIEQPALREGRRLARRFLAAAKPGNTPAAPAAPQPR